MAIFSYVVARDYGFAPNPFFGWCTLATCMPSIRKAAQIGDWIVGLGGAKYGLKGRVVYAMRVEDALPFDNYWSDSRFLSKRPNLRAGLKHAFGDNIYHRNSRSRWIQEPSHHSRSDGRADAANVAHDTKTDRVLVTREFCYWGGGAVVLPTQFKAILIVRGNRNLKDQKLIEGFSAWFAAQSRGLVSAPAAFPYLAHRRIAQ